MDLVLWIATGLLAGVALVAGGLILPAVLGVATVIVPITGVCWVLLMVAATVTHGRLGQPKLAMLTSGYMALAAFVARGRFGLEPLV